MSDTDIELNEDIIKARERIELKMDELKHFSYGTLLIYAAVISLELQDKGLSWKFPEGFDYNTYAAKMLLKGAQLAKQYHSKKANELSHAETNQFKQEIRNHYSENKITMFQGKKTLAYTYYEKQYPVKYDTIRKWLTKL